MMENRFLNGNERITAAIADYREAPGFGTTAALLLTLVQRMREDGHLLIPTDQREDEEGQTQFFFKTTFTEEGEVCMAAFTDEEELHKGPKTGVLSYFMDEFFRQVVNFQDCAGVMLNPWGEACFLPRTDLLRLLELAFPPTAPTDEA